MSTERDLLSWLRPRAAEAVDYALLQGALKYAADGTLTHAPFALSPSPVQPAMQQNLVALTVPYNRLAHAVARDTAFLKEELGPIARVDAFTGRLLDGMRGEILQPLRLQVTRSDYFIHQPPQGAAQARQVELNTIAAGYGALSGQITQLHRYLLQGSPFQERLIDNHPLSVMVTGFVEAVRRYGYPGARVLMVVQPGESNVFDQRLLEFALRDQDIITRRATLEEIARDGALREGHLVYRGEIAAVTYFRAAYGPEDLATPEALRVRAMIEAASTIAVPDLATQLAGTKKVQQRLTDPAILRRFCGETDAALLEQSFAAQYDLNQVVITPAGESPAWQAAMADPAGFVLKPQREGGGHNFFGDALRQKLEELTAEERSAYVLMDRLRPEPHPALLVREGRVNEVSAVSEIGRFGVLVTDGAEEVLNRDAGYLVRTKAHESQEGGVSAGYGFLDSLLLAS